MNNVIISEDELRALAAKLDEVLALIKELRFERDYGKAALDNMEATARAWQARPEGEP